MTSLSVDCGHIWPDAAGAGFGASVPSRTHTPPTLSERVSLSGSRISVQSRRVSSSGGVFGFSAWLPASHVYTGAGITRAVPPSIRPLPVIVDAKPEHRAAKSSCTSISTASSPRARIVIVWVLPSPSVETQLPRNGLRGSSAGTTPDGNARSSAPVPRTVTSRATTPARIRLFRCLRSRLLWKPSKVNG